MIWASVIAGIAATVAALIGLVNREKINQVHIMVDGRLDAALQEIRQLKASLRFEKTQPPEGPES